MKTLKYRTPQASRWLRKQTELRAEALAEAAEAAAVIVSEVREEGDRAVSRSIRRFDRGSLRPNEILERLGPKSKSESDLDATIDRTIERIRQFHERQVEADYAVEIKGLRLQHRVRPIERVGVYVPGGKAIYISTLMMCVVPARLAGVDDIVVATPMSAAKAPEFRTVCRKLGIREIYRAGGPAAIAAMALGTQTLKRVDKIVGPGNRYVVAAKQLLSPEVGIDMTAGPAEIVILADETADVETVGAELLACAGVGDGTLAICVTPSLKFEKDLLSHLRSSKRTHGKSIAAERSLERSGAILLVSDEKEAVQFINEHGPQQVQIITRDPAEVASHIVNSASIVLGARTPVTLGSYAGPNHVLPTDGTARFNSPLGVYHFYRRTNIVEAGDDLASEIFHDAIELARAERKPLHAASLESSQEGSK